MLCSASIYLLGQRVIAQGYWEQEFKVMAAGEVDCVSQPGQPGLRFRTWEGKAAKRIDWKIHRDIIA